MLLMRICRKGISFSGRSDMHEQVAGSSAWSLPSSVTSQAVRVQRRVITSRGRVSDHVLMTPCSIGKLLFCSCL